MDDDMAPNDGFGQEKASATVEQDDISDALYARIKPFNLGNQGKVSTPEGDRDFIDDVVWILRTGAVWKQFPERFDIWEKIYRKFIRWRAAGVWESLFEIFLEYLEMEWLLLDASKIEVSQGGKHKPVWFLPSQWYICLWMRFFLKPDAVMKKIPLLMVGKIAGS